jgi:hypothetical protein
MVTWPCGFGPLVTQDVMAGTVVGESASFMWEESKERQKGAEVPLSPSRPRPQ